MVTIQTDPLAARTSRKSCWLDAFVTRQASEYFTTFLTEFLVMASQLITYKLAAHQLGKSGFSEYALARRTVSLLFPVPVLGLSVGLPRYIGFANGRGDQGGAARYYGAALWCIGGAALCCFLAMNLFAKTFAYLLFGNAGYSYLVFPLSLIVVALCIHTVVCGYFRGHMDMNRANLLQFVNLALVPILSFLVIGSSLSRTLTSIGVISTLVSVVGLLKTPFRAIALNNLKEAGELFRYGIQRVPGDFVLMALFTLPATFVAHLKGVQEAGIRRVWHLGGVDDRFRVRAGWTGVAAQSNHDVGPRRSQRAETARSVDSRGDSRDQLSDHTRDRDLDPTFDPPVPWSWL